MLQVLHIIFNLCNLRIITVMDVSPTAEDKRTTVENLATVALIPGSDDVPLARFALELTHSLSAIGEGLFLQSLLKGASSLCRPTF